MKELLTKSDLVSERECNTLRFATDADVTLDVTSPFNLLNAQVGKGILALAFLSARV